MPKSGLNAADMEETGNGYFLKSCFGDFPSEYATSTGNHQFATEKWAQFDEANSPLTA
jgi:hypothetical protein